MLWNLSIVKLMVESAQAHYVSFALVPGPPLIPPSPPQS